MKSKWQGIVILTVVFALCAGGAALAGEKKNVWVTEDEHVMALHGHHGAKFLADDGEVFDLADLRDGETRTFGDGAKQVTVTRDDKIVTIVRAESGEERKLEIKCQIDKDTCQVMTFEDEPEKVMVIVKKMRTCHGEESDCAAEIGVHLDGLDLGEGSHAIIRKIECNDAGECEEFEEMQGGAELEIITDVHHGGGGDMIFVTADEMALDKIVMRCPEGDAKIVVDKDEADQTYLCPKHSVPMEKASPRKHHARKIIVKQKDD